MAEINNEEGFMFSDNNGCYFNGFRLESIKLASYQKPWKKDDPGSWRYYLEVPAEQASDEEDRRFYSKWYKTPKAAIAALDTKLRPWIHPRWWIITIPLILYFSYQEGEKRGEMNGAKYQFVRLCGDTADNMLHKKIPDSDNEVPAYVQNYCKEWLLDDVFTNSSIE